MKIVGVEAIPPASTKPPWIWGAFSRVMLAETSNVPLAPRSPYFGFRFLPTLHVPTHLRQASWIERLFVNLEATPLTYTIPDAPGVVLEVDPGVIRRYRIEEGRA